MHPRLLAPAVGLAALALAAAGCTSSGSQTVAAARGPVTDPQTEAAVPAADPAQGSPSAAATATAAASASASATASPTATRAPAPTYDVKAVQTKLSALHYYVGAVDGQRGPALRSALMAFQKVQGLGADGVVGAGTLAALKAPKSPALRASSPADRVEVDLSKQVLYVVHGGTITRILPVSSGNGMTYHQKNGSTAKALTPVGWYRVQRRIVGERKADLGSLYDPQYFYKGWAIHGSNSVPAYPASHGCVRVTRWDAKYLLGTIGVGTSVYVYGGRYTFTAGSSAPGTDNPTGDTPSDTPTATATPTPSPTAVKPSPTRSATPKPTPSKTATPTPTPTKTA